jgi:hypothetical protein
MKIKKKVEVEIEVVSRKPLFCYCGCNYFDIPYSSEPPKCTRYRDELDYDCAECEWGRLDECIADFGLGEL